MNALKYFIERFGPFTIAAITAFALVWFRMELTQFAANESLDLARLYAAVFDWASIQTGFLFGVFGYVGGKTDGFIAAVKNTDAMRVFTGYMRFAIVLGFALTLVSIPLMVVGFSIKEGTDLRYFTFVTWAFTATWAFFAFLRVAYVFGILIRPDIKERTVG